MPPRKKITMIHTELILMHLYNEWYNLTHPEQEYSLRVV